MTRAPTRIVILGAAGRDFHNFNVVYRNDTSALVVAFTAPSDALRRPPGRARSALRLGSAQVTIEEREEYEPHLEAGPLSLDEVLEGL